MTDLDTQEPLSNLSDSSFVILGQGSLPPQINTDDESIKNDLHFSSHNHTTIQNCEYRNESLQDRFSSSWRNGSFFSEEGIQKKLDELVKENYQLKETLSQNNLAIKSQFDIFFMWQQEVLKTHKSHKEKFLETKDLILKLRAENMSLRKQLEDSFVEASVVNDNQIYAQVNKKPEELEKLNNSIKDLEQICQTLIEENTGLNMKNQSLIENLKVAENENFKLKEELKILQKENTYLKNKEQDSNNNSFSNTSNKPLLNSQANLLTQIDDKKAKVLNLKEELNANKPSTAETSKFTEAEQLNNCIDKLDGISGSIILQNQKLNSLQSWDSLTEGNLKENKTNKVEYSLTCEINKPKSYLYQQQFISEEKQESIQELRKQYAELLDEYKALQLNLSFLDNKEGNIKFYSEKISCLSAELKGKDDELRLKQQECNSLKEDIAKLNYEKTVLNMQIQQYETDFMEERKANERALAEKEMFSEKIGFLEGKLKKIQPTTFGEKNIGNAQMESSEEKKENIKCERCLGDHDINVCSFIDFCE